MKTRRARLGSLLPVAALAALAIGTAISVGCAPESRDDQGLTEDRITGARPGYGYCNDYGYYGYGEYGYGEYGCSGGEYGYGYGYGYGGYGSYNP